MLIYKRNQLYRSMIFHKNYGKKNTQYQIILYCLLFVHDLKSKFFSEYYFLSKDHSFLNHISVFSITQHKQTQSYFSYSHQFLCASSQTYPTLSPCWDCQQHKSFLGSSYYVGTGPKCNLYTQSPPSLIIFK